MNPRNESNQKQGTTVTVTIVFFFPKRIHSIHTLQYVINRSEDDFEDSEVWETLSSCEKKREPVSSWKTIFYSRQK
jgi:hypothetical protein